MSKQSFSGRFFKSSHPGMFLMKGVMKICSKFTGEQPCQSVISIKLQSNFIEIALRHGCSPVNLLHIFKTPFPRNTSGWLLLIFSRRGDKVTQKNENENKQDIKHIHIIHNNILMKIHIIPCLGKFYVSLL